MYRSKLGIIQMPEKQIIRPQGLSPATWFFFALIHLLLFSSVQLHFYWQRCFDVQKNIFCSFFFIASLLSLFKLQYHFNWHNGKSMDAYEYVSWLDVCIVWWFLSIDQIISAFFLYIKDNRKQNTSTNT